MPQWHVSDPISRPALLLSPQSLTGPVSPLTDGPSLLTHGLKTGWCATAFLGSHPTPQGARDRTEARKSHSSLPFEALQIPKGQACQKSSTPLFWGVRVPHLSLHTSSTLDGRAPGLSRALHGATCFGGAEASMD